jgi:hypothetical protein
MVRRLWLSLPKCPKYEGFAASQGSQAKESLQKRGRYHQRRLHGDYGGIAYLSSDFSHVLALFYCFLLITLAMLVLCVELSGR